MERLEAEKRLKDLLTFVGQQGASDLHLVMGRYPTLRINGRRPTKGAIDFGSNVPLYVSSSSAREEQLMDDAQSSTALSVGAEGYSLSDVFTASVIAIDEHEMKDVPIQVPKQWNYETECIIGMPILKRFRFLFNFPNNVFWCLPVASNFDEAFAKDRSGLGVVASKQGLCVVHVAARSPAELAGIRIGDEIIQINGKDVDVKFLQSGKRIGTSPSGTSIEIAFSNGSRKTIVLRDYF